MFQFEKPCLRTYVHTVLVESMERRTLLSSLLTAGTVAIAGCSGNQTQSDEQETNFSTEGNDSKLIQSPVEDFTLTTEDLPGSGWQQDNSVANDGFARQVFSRSTSQNNIEGITFDLRKESDVPAAKERYTQSSPETFLGQAVDSEDTQELDIGIESVAYSWYDENAQMPLNMMKIRDANVFSRLVWTVVGSEDNSVSEDPVTLEQIGKLGVTIHEKWR